MKACRRMEFLGLLVVIGLIMYIQSRVYTKNAFRELTYECRFSCKEACEGDDILLIETLSNKKWLPIPWLKAELNTTKWLEFADSQSVVTDKTRFVPSFFMIGGYKKIERAWKVKCLKRGRFEVSAVLVSTDLFGRALLSGTVQSRAEIVILPKPYDFELPSLCAKQMMGETIVKRHLIPDPFMISGVREYTERDGVNKIHWSATAKVGHIMVYNNDYTSQQSLCVILNMQSRAFENVDVIDKEPIEDCIRICARLFDNALVDGNTVCFLANTVTENEDTKKMRTFEKHIETHSFWGQEHVHDLLLLLADLTLTSTRDFDSFLEDIYDNVTASDIFIVTNFLDNGMFAFAQNKGLMGVNVTFFMTGKIPEKPLPYGVSVCFLGGDDA